MKQGGATHFGTAAPRFQIVVYTDAMRQVTFVRVFDGVGANRDKETGHLFERWFHGSYLGLGDDVLRLAAQERQHVFDRALVQEVHPLGSLIGVVRRDHDLLTAKQWVVRW